jgi:hypothetical protein
MIYITQVFSYSYTFLVNPGIPRKSTSLQDSNPNKLKTGYRFCNQCRLLTKIDDNTNHCDDCNVCIEGIVYFLFIGYDHHCPWTSKCIGKGNLFGFYVFVTSTMLLFGYIVFALSMVNSN